MDFVELLNLKLYSTIEILFPRLPEVYFHDIYQLIRIILLHNQPPAPVLSPCYLKKESLNFE